MFRNFKLIIFVVAICNLSLISAMGSYKSQEIDEEQFDELIEISERQLDTTCLPDVLVSLIQEYRGYKPSNRMIEQTHFLATAIIYGSFPLLKSAIEGGACIYFRYYNGDTVLTRMLKSDKKEKEKHIFLQYLLEHGADINGVDMRGKTPLLISIEKRLDSITDLLKAEPKKGKRKNYKKR